MPETPDERAEELSEEDGYYHYHMRMTVEMCFTVNTDLVNADTFRDPFYQQNMSETTKHAYQQLLTSMLTDPLTRRRFLATMLVEKAWDLYHNEDDILEDLAPEEGLVTGQEDKRIELEDLVQPHLVPGAPYYWWKDPEASVRTLEESEANGGLDTEPLHATIDEELCSLSFEEIEPDD